jgi:hypothetical protein
MKKLFFGVFLILILNMLAFTAVGIWAEDAEYYFKLATTFLVAMWAWVFVGAIYMVVKL